MHPHHYPGGRGSGYLTAPPSPLIFTEGTTSRIPTPVRYPPGYMARPPMTSPSPSPTTASPTATKAPPSKTPKKQPPTNPVRRTTAREASSLISKTSVKREKEADATKVNPFALCINNNKPSQKIERIRYNLLKYHDANPMDGKPPQTDNVSITYLPNISYASGNYLNGFVFAVERPKNFNQYSISGSRKTKIIADVFPRDKLFSGMTCVRIPNILRSKILSGKGMNRTPYQVIESMGYVQLDKTLRETIKDYADLSGEGSYAGFYVSQDLSRHGERQLWIVVSTGQTDISRTTHAYISGIYNPYGTNSTYEKHISFREDLKKYQDHLNSLKEQVSEVLKSPSIRSSSSGSSDYGSSSSYDDDSEEKTSESSDESRHKKSKKKRRRRKDARSSSKRKDEDEFSSPSGLAKSGTRDEGTSTFTDVRDARELARKIRKQRLLKKQQASGKGKRSDESVTMEEKITGKLMEEDQLQAWKYVKLLRSCFDEIRLLEKTLNETYYSKRDDELLRITEEPFYIQERQMHWETTLMNEKFITDMCSQAELKRWLVVDKLAKVIGIDLLRDMDIDPTGPSGNAAKNDNVIHVTTNTFSTYNRSSKMFFYSGSFCKTTLHGAIPVPISPLDGISILKGPPTPEEAEATSGKDKSIDFSCVAALRDTHTNETIPVFSTVKSKYSESVNVDTLTRYKVDMDLGGVWSVESSEDSIYLRGAFPFGTGRKKKYLNPKPDFLPALDIPSFTNPAESRSGAETLPLILCVSHETVLDLDESEDHETHTTPKSRKSSSRHRSGRKGERTKKRAHSAKPMPYDMISNESWGPRGIIDTGNNKMLFTWENTAYHSHPRLAEGVFHSRNEAFQVREWQLGYQRKGESLRGMAHLIPYGVILASPGFVQNRTFTTTT